MPNSLENLHRNLTADGYNLGSLDDFKAAMADSTKASNLHKNLSADGYNLGSRDDFFREIGLGGGSDTKAAVVQQQTERPAEQAQGQTEAGADAPGTVAGVPRVDLGQMKRQFRESAGRFMQDKTAGGPQGGTPLSKEDKARMMSQTDMMLAQQQDLGRHFEQRWDDAQAAVGNMSAGRNATGNVGVNTNLRKGRQKFNAETGRFEDTYVTQLGNEYRNLMQAEDEQGYVDAVREQERYFGNLKSLLGPLGDFVTDEEKSIDERLQDAANEIAWIENEIKAQPRVDVAALKREGKSKEEIDALREKVNRNSMSLDAALNEAKRRQIALEAERDDRGQSMFWRGTWDTLRDPSTYTNNMADLSDQKAFEGIKREVEQAQKEGRQPRLTNGEKFLVRNYLMNQEAQQLNENRGSMYGYGQMFGASIPFMAEFALTGGFAGVGKAGTKLGTKAGLRYLNSSMGRWMMKNMGAIPTKALQYSLKGAGWVGGAAAGGALQSNTIGMAKTMADIESRYIGNMTIGSDGQIAFKDAEGLGEAILKGELTNIGENGSELLGGGFDFLPNILGRVIKRSAVGAPLRRLASNKAWRAGNKTLDYLGVQGVFGEGMEEEANSMFNAIIGESNWFKDPNDPSKPAFFDGKEQLDTWISVGLTSMILRGPQMAGSGFQKAQYYGYKYNMGMSNRRANKLFGADRWAAVREQIDNSSNKTLGQTLNGYLNDASLSREEKQAMMMYANDLVMVRGFNMATMLANANGVQGRARTDRFNVRGNVIEELDAEGNVIESHEYEDRDEMKAGLYELQQKRANQDMLSDIEAAKVRPDGFYDAFLDDFLSGGMPKEELEAMLQKDPMERSDWEQAVVNAFSSRLHSMVYDNTELHEEQSTEDGQDVADEMAIDLDETDGSKAQEVAAAFNTAKQAREQLFAGNEELAQEVLTREVQGVSPQEILSSLDTFREEDVQVLIDYYNQKARMEGMMNRLGQHVEEEARRSRENHTFKGTINGKPTQTHVYTITDGTNEYYLVSGNVATDPDTGQITGSDSGLVIGMDSDGSFVSLGDASGYSVLPPTQSLDEFEEAERARLGELVTAAVDPEGAMGQEAAVVQQQTERPMVQEGAGLDNAGGEAGQEMAGGNKPQAAAPSIPVDESGVKRYEQGVAIDDAIADMEADGLDVNAETDLAISEAQAELDKIKAPKTRAERVKNAQRQQELQGAIDYYTQLKQRYGELHPPYVDPRPYIDRLNATTSKRKADEIVSEALQAGVKPEEIQPVHTQRVSDIIAKEEEDRRKAEEITDYDLSLIEKHKGTPEGRAYLLDRKRVPSAEKRRKIAQLVYGELFDGDFDAWRDEQELISLWLGKGRALDPDSFGQELGWDMGVGKDAAKVSTMFTARRDNGGDGMLFNDFVHMVMEASGGRYDTEEIRDAVIAMFQGAQEKSDLTEYQLTSRVAEAEQALRGREEMEQEAKIDETADADASGTVADEDMLPFGPDIEGGERPAFLSDDGVGYDSQGNPIDAEGRLILNPVDSIDEITDEDFESPTRNIQLPQLPENVQSAIGTNGKPVVIKKSVFEKNGTTHVELEPGDSRSILKSALYNPNLVGQTQPITRPDYKVAIQTGDKNAVVVLDVYAGKDNVEIVGWRYVNEKGLEKMKRQAEREGGQFLILSPSDGSAAALSALPSTDLSSEGKDTKNTDTNQEKEEKKEEINTSDPLEAIEQAAESVRENRQTSDYGKDNKLVTQDRYEELKKRMKAKLLGQLNAGFDPEILAIGTEMAVFHIEAGARKFGDFAQRMIDELGDAIRPYLKGIYNGAREMPGMEELRKQMTSYEGVSMQDVQKIANTADNSVNEHKEENDEAENVVSLQQESPSEGGRQPKLAGEVTAEHKSEDADKYRAFSQSVADDMLAAMEAGERPYKSIKDIRAKAKGVGLEVDDEGRTDILLQELVEDGLVSAARQYVNAYVMQQVLSGRTAQDVRQSRDLFNDIVKLYQLQPSITQRSSNRIKMQQYSTPLPMSFVADVFAYSDGMKDVLEPTAGNGMMVFAIPESSVHANELDATRLDNLRAQKFKKVTDQDATEPFEGNEQYDAVIANPPFGGAVAKEYDGKMIPGLAEQIALNALSKMKDDGKAAIIIGGNMEYAPNGAIKSDKAFFTYLYDHYNVKGVIDMDGKLYSRQGTTYPTRMILIDGRRSEEERAQTKVYPPVKDNAPRKATTFDELFDIAEEIRNNNNKTNGNEVLRTSGPVVESNTGNTQRQSQGERRRGESDANGTDGQSRSARRTGGEPAVRGNEPGVVQQPSGVVSRQNGTGGLSTVSQRPSATDRGETRTDNGRGSDVGGTERVQPARPSNKQTGQQRDERVEEKRELTSDKLPYRPHNGAFSLESVAPAAMVEAMDNTLKEIEREFGNVDDFVTTELGYDSAEEMHNALAAEQVDSVAMAIWNMKKGEGMVIGDQTGVGKGRQMAALIRWAVRQGKKPVFVTKDADLFSDIYRDLVDIGSGDLRPFIFNSGVTITDANGRVVHKSLSDATQKKVLAMDELPDGFDFAILSYPQMNTGDRISQEESGKEAKDRGERGKKGKAVKAGRPTPKADFLRKISKDNYLLMDESQNAAGSGNTGAYFQSILKDAKAVTFASATFAKRPDTMPLYAIRTAISKAKVKTWELIQMISKGGVTLQEIMSRAMTSAGQMVRRERDMSDVRTDWKTIDAPETSQKARRDYDNVMRAFNAIISFQEDYIAPVLAAKSAEFASMASTVTERRGTEKAGVDNPPFVNRLYNFSKQLLLSLKVDAVVDEVVKEIEAGHKPVIALENTLESALDEYAVGDTIDDPTLFGKLKKGLDACFRYTIKNEDGDEMGGVLQPEELGEEGERAYNELVDLIQESTQGMFISPLDAITEKLKARGIKVGEISGRKSRAVFVSDADASDTVAGHYEVRKRENTDRKKLARDFNSGDLDVLIINKTGSTGISLHASKRFTDQRPRTMIMAQPLSDINDYMQMIGRIDRTGQVHRGYYINLGLPVPAETRFMMMLANKLKSLNANTTTSQENKDNEVDAPDLLNKYGDQVMIEYLRDNPDVYRKLGEFLKDRSEPGASTVSAARLDEYKAKEGDARQITGRVALLSVDEQDDFYDDVTRRYNELIKYLNDTNSNDLKITVMPLRARTIDRQVSSEGTAPGTTNPFADNAYVEWVEMDILKKPMKADEVSRTIEQLNPEGRVQQIIATVERETQEKLDKEQERYEAAKAKAEEDIKAKAEAINGQQKRTPEQKKEAVDKYATEKRQALEESHQKMVNKIDANHERLMKYLRMFSVGDSVLVPDDLTTDAFLGSVNGIFCGFKAKDENVTQSTTLAVFVTLDGRRKIEVKISDWNALARINNMTQENWDAAQEVTLSNWDSQIPTSSRKHGYIMTGNILQAISDTNFQGHLITFTDSEGNVRDGLLMPDKWEPSQLKGATVPISQRKERIKSLPMKDKVTSADGRVTITRYWGYYHLDVPKSKKQGGEFYLDKRLLDLVNGNDFFTASGNMRGTVPNENIDAVLDRLGEMGVTLPSDRKVEFNETIDTEDPIDAIRQAANGWRRSVKESESSLSESSQVNESEKKSVPLERRTMKSYTDKDGNYHTGIEEEIAGLESDIARAGREDAGTDEKVSEAQTSSRPVSGRRVNELRREAAKLRAEIARRNQKKQDLRKKYNIDEKGNISLDDLTRMFRDLNSNKVLGKLFDKVFDILNTLGTKFRFSDNFDALTGGEAFGYLNGIFLNWDVYTRDVPDQQKAKTILHEMIHGVAYQLLDRYENQSVRKLSAAQEKLAKEIFDIYEAVKKANPKDKKGGSPYGLTSAHEMLSEIANPEFRNILDSIPYREGMSVWQRLKEWLKDVLGSFGLDIKGNTALNSLEKAFDDVIDNYDDTGIGEYSGILSEVEQDIRNAGYKGDIMDLVEENFLDGGGTASLVEDEELIKRLESEPKIKVYRAMQLQGGKLYPPMAAKVNGKWQDPLPLGEWSQADEHPELVDKNGKFTLDKGNGKTVAGVVYAPYMHGSTTMLNDQFKEAQDRPELVVVEAEMPESELTSGYQAEKSPRRTGRLPWKAGTIQGQLTGTRDVILSRWVKPIRIVPASEVAQSIKQMIDGQVEVMPTNVVTPEQREELEKLGVKFVKTSNQEIVQEGEHKGEQYSDAYGKKAKRKARPRSAVQGRKKAVDGDPIQAIKDAASKWVRGKADREGMTPEAHSAKAVYNERLNTVEMVFAEAYQDAMVSLKTAQNAIAQDKDIPDSQNAYMAENLMHGKNKNEQDLYNKMFRDPLIATINKIMNATGMNWGDVDRYVYTKSGLERNREFFVRDWLAKEMGKTTDASELTRLKQLSDDWQDKKNAAYEDLQDGFISFAEYLEELDRFVRTNLDSGYVAEDHDYSGFRAMFGDEEGEYDEAAIIEELMEQEGAIADADASDTVATLWEQIRGATRYGLERYREAGMRSDEQIDQIESMFHWYVPMRGFKEDKGEDMYQYFTAKGTSKSYVGGLLKHAKGRGSEANYPISTIFAMTYKAISDCNQNMVNQKLYRLCQANPNDLIVLSDSWAVLNEATGEWEEVAPEIDDDMSEEEIREATLAWEENMRQMASAGNAKKITGRAQLDYKPIDKKNRSEHVVEVRINGQPKRMTVVGNPRMAQALNGQLRFERGKNIFSKWNASIKNMMASLFTTYSPTFALRNMFRDWTHFRMMLEVREGHGYAARANKYYRQSLFKMVGLFKKYREGTLDESKEIERDFKDFMDNGGITGFVFMQKIDDIQKEMEDIYKKQKAGKPIRLNNNIWEKILGAVEAVNEGIENNARFATYRTSRHYAGRTKARSAYDAKEITVNFNRKGAGGKTYGFKSQSKAVEDAAKAFGVTSQILGEGRIFFNATVQAIATTFKNFQNQDGSLNKKYIAKWASMYALPPFMFGLALPMINKALAAALDDDGDDDPYANLAEWTRRRNICIYIGGDNFITIPVGQELAAFLSLGDIVAGNTYAPELKPVDRSWDEEIVGVMNTFSPVDISTKITKGGLMEDPISEVAGRTFSVLAPLVAVEQNLGWTGRPIYREDRYPNDKFKPEYQQVYSGTNPVLVGASQLLSEASGGNERKRGAIEINPAIVQYLWEQYAGGPGKVFSNTISIGKDAKDLLVNGEAPDFNIRKVEGIKAFIQQGDDRTQYYRAQTKFWNYSDKADQFRYEHDIANLEKQAKTDPMARIELEELKRTTDYIRMDILREANRDSKKEGKVGLDTMRKNAKTRAEKRAYNEAMKAVVDLLDEVGEME